MPAGRLSRARLRPLAVLVLVPLTLLVYWPVGGFQFVNLDDYAYLRDNPLVRGGLSREGLGSLLTLSEGGNWHPLTWLSHMVDVELLGLDPGAHHLMNLAFHVFNILLLFLALRVMTGAFWRSLAVAALFAVHPLNVESVAWVSARKNTLSTLFWLLAILAYLAYVRRPRPTAYLGVALLFTLGLLAKPVVVTFPFVLLLLDGWPLGRWRSVPGQGGGHPWPLGRWRSVPGQGGGHTWSLGRLRLSGPGSAAVGGRLLLEKAPLLLLSASVSLVTYLVQARDGALVRIASWSPATRVEKVLLNYLTYLRKMLWPGDLAVTARLTGHPAPAAVIAAILVLGALSAACLLSARARPYGTVGWFWYLGTLVPVIGIVQVGLHDVADRFAYVPLIGLFLAGVWALGEAASRGPRRQAAATALVLLLLFLLVPAARRQVSYWRDTGTLFERTLAVNAGDWNAHSGLGTHLEQIGRIEEAVRAYRRSLELAPNQPQVRNNLGGLLIRLGLYDEAVRWLLEEAVRCPADASVRYKLGLALFKKGEYERAAGHLQRALELDPRQAPAWVTLGNIRYKEARFDEAAALYRRGLDLEPDDAVAHNNLGLALVGIGRIGESLPQYHEALRLKPDYANAHANLGVALSLLGKPGEAAEHFREALRLNPDDAVARHHLQPAEAR